MEKITVKQAIERIAEEIKNDPGYKIGWVANIAMAYTDNENWYKTKTGKKRLNSSDKHLIANQAAEYFLEQLCK